MQHLPPSSSSLQPPEEDGPDRAQGNHGPWFADLHSLVQAGQISEKVLVGLPNWGMNEEAGSWLDPLFQGPAPIAEFEGLGERYTQLRFLGEGASGTVYKALDTLLQRWIALKVLKGASPRALAEARAQAQVEHPNVCRVYEVGRGFIVMQLVEGPTLATLGPTLDLQSKVAMLQGIAKGIHAAHERGMLHLDLKLSNILLQHQTDGTFAPIVGDFGMTMDQKGIAPESCPFGTPPYSSPEQLAGDPKGVSPASDIYTLGILAYILFSGRAPYQASSLEALISDMVQAPPIPLRHVAPDLSDDLVKAVEKCMEKDPARRYSSAGELADEFDRFLRLQPMKVMGTSTSYRAMRWAQRNRLAAKILGMGIIAVAISLGAGFWRESRIAQRFEWDRHFQKRVEETRMDLERAFRRPPHDVSGDLDQVQKVIEEIREEMNKQGKLASGPAHLALGQLLLARDPQSVEAAEHFQKAWDDGLRTEGARTWMAYALLTQYEETIRESQRQGSNSVNLDRGALRSKFLEPARKMLKGRGDVDQTRLAHMADLIEARIDALTNHPKLVNRSVDLTVEYRIRAPQDLDALLEEIDSRFRQIEGWLQDDTGRLAPERLNLAWKELTERLREGATNAPSHPLIYRKLAKACLMQLDYQVIQSLPRHVIRNECRSWILLGLKVTPDDPDLQASQIALLSREGLERDRPLAEVNGDIFRILLESGRSRGKVLDAIRQYVSRGYLRNLDLLPVGIEALASVRTSSRERLARSSFGNHLMAMAILQGQDPAPILDALGLDVEPWTPFSIAIAQAEWLITSGRICEIDLDRLKDLRRQLNPNPPKLWMWDLNWTNLCCRINGSKDDWAGLRHLFEDVDWAKQPENEVAFKVRTWVSAGINLVKHAQLEGQDPKPDLDRIESGLHYFLGNTLDAQIKRKVLGVKFTLCAAQANQSSPEEIQDAVLKIGEILERFGENTPYRDLDIISGIVPGKGTLLQLRGQLRLELSRRLQKSARRQSAQQAESDFTRALAHCPDLRKVLLPLQQEANRQKYS